jgi:hypothetical protein
MMARAKQLKMKSKYLKSRVPVRLQICHAAPVTEMQQILQAAVLRGNEIGAKLQRPAVRCEGVSAATIVT